MRDGQKKSSEPAGSAAEEKPRRSPVPLASRKSSRRGDDDDQVTIPPSSRQASPQHGQQPIRSTPSSSSEFATDDYRLTITLDPNQQNGHAISIAIIDLHHGNNYRTVIMPNHLVTHLEPAEATPIVISGQLPVPLQQIQGFYGFLSESFRRIIDNDTAVGEGVSGVIQHQRNVNEALSSYLMALSFCAGSGWTAVSFSCDICVAFVPHASEESRLQASLDILRYETREKEAKLEREVAQLKGIVQTLLQFHDGHVHIVDPTSSKVVASVDATTTECFMYGSNVLANNRIDPTILQAIQKNTRPPYSRTIKNSPQEFSQQFLCFHFATELLQLVPNYPVPEHREHHNWLRDLFKFPNICCSTPAPISSFPGVFTPESPLRMFAPLAACKRLRVVTLTLPHAQQTLDVSFFDSLGSTVEVLFIQGCSFVSLDFLRPLKKLRKLFLHSIQPSPTGRLYDLSVLAELPNLEVVSFFMSDCLVADLRPLLDVRSLVEVHAMSKSFKEPVDTSCLRGLGKVTFHS